MTSITGNPDAIADEELNVSYTDFRKIKTLTEGAKQYSITYGIDDQRRRTDFTADGNTLTRYYMGDYEEESDNIGNVKKIHYLSGGAVLVQDNGVETLYYGYTDNQGSLIALTDQNGSVVENYAYDPWGTRRNPADWQLKDARSGFITNRGYTGHEHYRDKKSVMWRATLSLYNGFDFVFSFNYGFEIRNGKTTVYPITVFKPWH